jgi:hypothetical protein
LIFRYKNLKGTTSAGNVIMSFDYDALDAAPTTAVEQCQSTWWIDGAPWRMFELKVPVNHLPPLYTRRSLVGGSDLKTYDIGQLFVATEGCADSSDHGYLEVEYECELMDKQVGGSGSSSVPSVYAANLSSAQVISTTTAVLDFDEEVANGLSVTNSSGTYTLPSGNYMVWYNWCTTVSGAGTVEILVDGVAQSPPVLYVTTYNDASISCYFTLAASGTLAFSATTSGATSFTADKCRMLLQRL